MTIPRSVLVRFMLFLVKVKLKIDFSKSGYRKLAQVDHGEGRGAWIEIIWAKWFTSSHHDMTLKKGKKNRICSHTYQQNQSLHPIDDDSPYSQNSWAAGARLATSPPYQKVNDCNVRVAWRHDSEHRLQNFSSWGAAFRTQQHTQRTLPSCFTE